MQTGADGQPTGCRGVSRARGHGRCKGGMRMTTTEDMAAQPAALPVLDPGGGANQVRVRAYNERLVLSLVRRHGSQAKSEIAKRTGLSAQTVSVIMRALEKEGLLIRGEPVRGRVGQPS